MKPTFNRVIPLLVYRDIQAAHDFLVNAFGFDSGGVERAADGQVVHTEVRVGSAPLWLHRVTGEHELSSPATGGSAGAGAHAAVGPGRPRGCSAR